MMKRLVIATGLLLVFVAFAFAIDFPNSPSNGQTYTLGNHTWTYNSSNGGWSLTDSGVTYPVTVPDGGTGQQTESEALGEMTESLSETTDPSTNYSNYYIPFYDSSSDTGKKVRLDRVGAMQLLASGQTVNVSTLDLPLSNDYKRITIILSSLLTPDADEVAFAIRVSQNGGSSFLSGASDYAWSTGTDCDTIPAAADCSNGNGDVTSDECFNWLWLNASTYAYGQMEITFYNPGTSSYPTWETRTQGISGTDEWMHSGGTDCVLVDTTSAAINYARIMLDDVGTFNAKYAVYGWRK